MAKDPVCGMTVAEDQAAAKVEYRGQTYYFCSSGCHKAFTAEPAKYLKPEAPPKPGGPRLGR